MNAPAPKSPPGPNRVNRRRDWLVVALLVLGIGFCLYLLRGNGVARPAAHYGLRLAAVALSLTAWFRSQSLIGSRETGDGAISDGMHEVTASLHGWLLSHPRGANAVLIVSSAFIDVFGLFLIGAGIFGPTLRPFVALLILFILRQIGQAVTALPAPREMIWRYPGFPSLLVTYGTASDFFFSGHTAIAVLGAIEIARLFPWWAGMAAGVVAAIEALTVLALRAHYSMDIIAAVLAACCAAGLSAWICSPAIAAF